MVLNRTGWTQDSYVARSLELMLGTFMLLISIFAFIFNILPDCLE